MKKAVRVVDCVFRASAKQELSVGAIPLAQQKFAVKSVSKSALSQGRDHKSFAFVPPQAPVQVRRWPKL